MSQDEQNATLKRILVVDDNPANVELLTSLLEMQAYQVQAVTESQAVLEEAIAFEADLILLDIMMPAIDGYEVCRQLKANEQVQDVPVIFISGINSIANKVKAFAVGGVDYITKPFQIEEVLVRVETHLTIRSLQQNLQSRNQALAQTLAKLKKAQTQLVQSEKMAALGVLVAGVAHEVNSPLGAIRSSIENIADFIGKIENLTAFWQQITPKDQLLFTELLSYTRITYELSGIKKRQVRKEITQVFNSAELNNADSVANTLVDLGITNLENVQKLLPLLKQASSQQVLDIVYQVFCLHKSTQTIKTATERATKVVLALKNYSHFDQSGKKDLANIIDGIEVVLTIYNHQLKRGIEVVKNYSSVPIIACNPDELNQVWTNLIQNALQAMGNRGTLTIEVTQHGDQIRVSISDTGGGISPELQDCIFEPFFTTKPSGQGTGLGLDIAKNIIEDHDGKIEVDSRPGKTVFTVWLPINVKEETLYTQTEFDCA